MIPGADDDTNSAFKAFRGFWTQVTDDNNSTLHGFRRFKTSHLLNLRYLETEIAGYDRIIYQAGLSLGEQLPPRDRLGLKHGTVDSSGDASQRIITQEVVLQLRDLMKQYDEALLAFGQIMVMETTSLLEDDQRWRQDLGLSMEEKYNTRLLRLDLGPRSRVDPLQRWLQKKLRACRYHDACKSTAWTGSNTMLVASIAARVITTCIVGAFLVVPLAILSADAIMGGRLAVICSSIGLFAVVVSTTLKVSSYEMMATVAAYAAVLSVFVSNGT